MNKLALLPLLMLPACAALPGQDGRLMRAALDHDQAVCVARGYQLGTDDYTRCMVTLGHKDGYRIAKADDGKVAFALPAQGGMGPAGGGTFYPGVYVPPQYSR
jgi:hypothetical protein